MLEIPASENSKASLDAIDRELASIAEKISVCKHVIESLESIAVENKEYEDRISEAKKTMFLLVHEKMQLGLASNAADYIALLEKDSSGLSATKDKK